jgi:cysteine desulfuration protein SufE
MFETCLEKQQLIKSLFQSCPTEEAKYEKIIALGKAMPQLEEQYKIASNLVQGCQSIMYLHSYKKEDKIYFEVASDALISAGLAALLIKVYSGETPETILKCPPTYLEELGITTRLTPSRANGLYSIHLKMKQEALKFLLGTA